MPAGARTTRRRGKGEGAVYKDADGLWVATIEAGRDPVTGRRLRRKVKARTKTLVLLKADETRRQLAAGVEVGGASTTLAVFAKKWLATVVTGRVSSPNTVDNYRIVLERHILPALGAVPLAKITPDQIDQFLAAKAQRYSKSYVTRMRTVLADCLAHAERRGLVARNVATLAIMPKCEPAAVRRSLTPDEARALLKAGHEDRLGALIAVGLMLGLRPGELTGLLWTDINLSSTPATLTVSGSMKRLPDSRLVRGNVKQSKAGLRTIALPPVLADILALHRDEQNKVRASANWPDDNLVFCSESGTPLDPSNVRRGFARVARKAGLQEGFPYLLRHSAASLLIDAGIGVEAVADLLGDDPRTLYRHYRHRVRPVADAAAGPMQALLGEDAVASHSTYDPGPLQ
jgi:integrase